MNTTLDLMKKRIEHNERKNSNNIIAINNHRIQNYIEARGIEPIKEAGRTSYYLRSRKLISLLESYEIENYIIPNR